MLICAFPGTGKSFLTKNYPEIFHDLDSGTYSRNPDGSRNPAYPDNYIEAILSYERKHGKHILIATHHELIRKLVDMGKEFIVITPHVAHCDEYMRRYTQRGSPTYFIQALYDNWERYTTHLMSLDNAIILDKDEYLSDVFDFGDGFDPYTVKMRKLKDATTPTGSSNIRQNN